MQPLATVDLDVEERVEEVEAGDPERDGAAEHPGLASGKLARDRGPGPDGREPVDGAEPEVAEPREPLQVRVDDEADDRDRPQPAHDRVELEDREQEQRERRGAEEQHLRTRQQSGRQLARRRARIARVELARRSAG